MGPVAVSGAIDWPEEGERVGPGSIRVRGWVLDPEGPLEDALLVVGELATVRPRLGILRPDIELAFPEVLHAGSSGFECEVDLRGCAGPVRIDLVVRTASAGWRPAAAITAQVAPEVPAGGASRARAAFTIVQNEQTMLPLWLEYYGRYFEADDLYVLDHASADGSTADLGGRCRVIPVHRSAAFEHRWLRATVEAFQRFLLQSYEVVVFAEADEFLIADPRRYGGLDEYVARLRRPAARAVGFNVIHTDEEPALRFEERPLLRQRRYWRASLDYCKRLVSKVPLRWSEGFHVEYSAPDDPPDPDLMLVHLHRVDYDFCLARHRSTASRSWSAEDLASGAGSQNRIDAEEQFARWFREGPDLHAPPELIPEHVRELL